MSRWSWFAALGVVLALFALSLIACVGAGQPTAAPTTAPAAGDAAAGQALFEQASLSGARGCSRCHAVQPGQAGGGPSLAGVATRAAEVVQSDAYQGQAADAPSFIRESIVEPDVYVEQGFSAGLMPQNYDETLQTQQIDDLVAYLMTLQ